MSDDPRQAAARYRLERSTRSPQQDGDAAAPASPPASPAPRADPARGTSAAERAAFVETSLQQAIRRGEFDDLPGAGKPLAGLEAGHDPDWWIRRKIETEQLTGLGPPALMLRVESAELADRLDALNREHDVREALDDFNRRVIEARRQLLGGPPVVTALRDVDAELAGWQARRAAREAAVERDEIAEAHRRRRPLWRRGGRRRDRRRNG